MSKTKWSELVVLVGDNVCVPEECMNELAVWQEHNIRMMGVHPCRSARDARVVLQMDFDLAVISIFCIHHSDDVDWTGFPGFSG